MTSAVLADLTARDLADAIWLAHQWHTIDRSATSAELLPRAGAPDGLPSATAQAPADSADPAPDPVGPDNALSVAQRLAMAPLSGPPRNLAGQPFGLLALPLRPKLDRAIPGALRPLRQVLPSHHARELDEEATAERAVVDPRWLPVFTPAPERRWNVVLVVDNSPAMALWRSTAREFAAMLIRQGAFQHIQVRLLDGDGEHGFTLRGNTPAAPRHGIAELFDPTGRRIVLVLTDGSARGWRTGAALSVLRRWGRTMPVAVLHLLPWTLWQRTGFATHRLRFRGPAPGAPNQRLRWQPQVTAAEPLYEDLTDTVPIPVLGLGARWLASWSRLVAGTTSGWTDLPAALVGRESADAPNPGGPAQPARQVAEFRAAATPITFELATYLAAAPLALDLMCQVQQTLLPGSDLAHLSEFLASGLVESITPVEAGPVRLGFEFGPGVREELLAAGRRATTAHVMRVVEECLADTVPEARGFGRNLDDEPSDAAPPAGTALSDAFLRVEMAALGAMSGNHLAAARKLRQRLTGGQRTDRNGPPAPAPGTSYRQSGRTPSPTELNPRTGVVQVPRTDRLTEERRTRPTTSPMVWGGVPPRNPNFTGREELLEQLNQRLEPGATTAVLPQALHGLGGVGKSQLAVEYAYRHRGDFDVIWWIPAELPVQIQSSLMELGQRLGLVESNEVNVVVSVVMDALKGSARGGRQIPANWLLVFDNAEDPESVMPYLPNGGPGRILVTSRNSQWLNLARPLEVDVFQRDESVELLQRRGPELDDGDADRLASALGDLPLAIEQAAAWRAETGMPAEEYIQLLNEKQAEMLGLPGPLDYQRSVAAAWNLSLDKLQASNPTALRILQVCAFFAPEPIPRAMFANGRSVSVLPDLDRALRDRLRLNEAIRDINRYALARIDHRNNSIQMHRLVQAVLITQMSEEEQDVLRHGAHLLLAANLPDAPDDDEQWPKYGQLYPHVIASNAIECEDSAVRELVFNQTQYLYHWGEHQASRDLAQQVYRVWQARLGPDHPDTLKVGRWFGFMLWVVGQNKEAAEFNARLLEIHRQRFGDGHEDTLDAVNSVTGDRRAEGDFAGALELTRENHQRCVARFGDYDPLTLNSAHNLGVSLRLSGLFPEALRLDELTWRRKVEIYGSDHPLSLLTQVGLTLDRRELGDYLEARTEHEEIVARYRALNGALHHHTLRAIHQQASMRRKAGDHEGAVEAADEAYDGLLSRFSPDHPETIAAALSRSINLRQAGNLDDARRVGVDVVRRYEQTLGNVHPHTMAARTILAVTLRLRHELAGARELNEEALAGFRRRLGENHPSALVTSINLASDLFTLGDPQAAYDVDLATTDSAAALLGANHPTTLAGRANLAQDLRALGREAESNALRTDVVTKTAARLGNSHPAVGEFANPDLRANCDIDPMPL
ncbi:MAG TPA: FxSxx-COOH system tetratricopeptide repeat protein [Pseudonocardiaceae bacterium]